MVDSGGVQVINSDGTASFTTVSRGGVIDLTALTFVSGASTAVVGGNDVLTVTEGGTSATVQLGGFYAGETFQPASDGGFGTKVTLIEPPRTLAWNGSQNTDFGAAANWNDLTDSLFPAAEPPNSADSTQSPAEPA